MLTASKRAASSMSPATPLKQSIYAIFILLQGAHPAMRLVSCGTTTFSQPMPVSPCIVENKSGKHEPLSIIPNFALNVHVMTIRHKAAVAGLV